MYVDELKLNLRTREEGIIDRGHLNEHHKDRSPLDPIDVRSLGYRITTRIMDTAQRFSVEPGSDGLAWIADTDNHRVQVLGPMTVDCNACAYCGVIASSGNDKKSPTRVSKCGGCQSVAYCSKQCQKKHWKQHKGICKMLNAQRTPPDKGGGGRSASAEKHERALDNLAVAAARSQHTVRRQLFLEVNSPKRKGRGSVDSPARARIDSPTASPTSACRLCGRKMRDGEARPLRPCGHRYHHACLAALAERGCAPRSKDASKDPDPARSEAEAEADARLAAAEGASTAADLPCLECHNARRDATLLAPGHPSGPPPPGSRRAAPLTARALFDRGVMYAVQAGAARGSAAKRNFYTMAHKALSASLALEPTRAAAHVETP